MSDHHDELEDHDLGLSHDLPRIVERERRWGRRGLLGLMGGVGAVAMVGCSADGDEATVTNSSTTTAGPPQGQPEAKGQDGGPGGA
jgi:hypothetical protein